MWNALLKETIFKPFKDYIYGFDIETYSNKNKFLCCSFYDIQTDHNYFFKTKRLAINFLINECHKPCTIAATNLSFDFLGLIIDQPEIMMSNLLFRQGNSDMLNGRIYIDNGKWTKKTGRNKINFIDTMNYSKCSVERAGSIIGIKKLQHPSCFADIPKNDNDWAEMEAYNSNDAMISGYYLKFLYQGFNDLGATCKLTIASTSMSLYTNRFLKESIMRHDRDDLLFLFKGYYGGRTESLKRGCVDNQKYKVYDVNSMYPYAMTLDYPDPRSLRKTFAKRPYLINDYDGVSDVVVESPEYMKLPYLPTRSKNHKLIFPLGSWRGCYSHFELRKAVELGYIIKDIKRTFYYTKTMQPFKEYIEFLYELRKKYKKEKNPQEEIIKLCMNSLYGKFASSFINKDIIEQINLSLDKIEKIAANHGSIEILSDKWCRIKQDNRPAVYCIPEWPLYVTSYARHKLWELANKHDSIYMDTDSITTKSDIDNSFELGGLKLEHKIIDGIFVKPKFYGFTYMNDKNELTAKLKIKGIPAFCRLKDNASNEQRRLTFEEFKDFCRNPSIEFNRFIKFRESIRRKLNINEIIRIKKELDVNDDKRNWNEPFNKDSFQESEPLKI
jgi:hypothetical protein